MISRESGDAVVVGAGLIGLAIAFELAERGATVRLYDRAEPGRAASWAGAGMLTPHTEDLMDEALLQLCEDSLAQYPAFVERVRSAGEIDPRLHLNGVVFAAFGRDGNREIERRCAALRARGVRCEILDRAGVLEAEPWLGADVTEALLVSGDGHIDNRRLGRALAAACGRRGVSIAQIRSLRVECDSRRALGVRTDRGFTAAGAIVNACGAWAGSVDGIPPAARPAVEPVKGQMLALEMPIDFVRRATWVPGAYLVPRDDGRLLVGATAERALDDVRVTAAGIHQLLHAVLDAAPALSGFTVSESWAGLRPGTPDGRPFLGRTPIEGLFVAAGHYRNGILLAPATARAIADAVEGGNSGDLAAFSLERLQAVAAASQETSP